MGKERRTLPHQQMGKYRAEEKMPSMQPMVPQELRHQELLLLAMSKAIQSRTTKWTNIQGVNTLAVL